jgi:hypothetical protein
MKNNYESCDYKGMFWDEKHKKFYTWKELQEVWKREKRNKKGSNNEIRKN